MEIHSEKIRKELKRLGLTQEEFAKKVGITRQALYYILKHRSTNLSTIEDMAQVLDVDAKDLLR